jgi:polysaccharide export outer membrane protein
MTVEELEAAISLRLKEYIRTPQVSVNITALKSQPVTVIGSVGTPGIHQLEGHKTLLEVLTLAGGPKPEAGPVVQITRKAVSGPLPIPSAKVLPNGTSVAEVNINGIVAHPEENIEILTEDILYVAKGEFVYVIGEVGTPGRFELNGKPGISLFQLLAIVGGPTAAADKENARILRLVPGSPADSLDRTEIAVNLKELMKRDKDKDKDKNKSKAEDQMLRPDDILLVPDSYTKGTVKRTLEGVLQTLTGMAIYRL